MNQPYIGGQKTCGGWAGSSTLKQEGWPLPALVAWRLSGGLQALPFSGFGGGPPVIWVKKGDEEQHFSFTHLFSGICIELL